MSKGRLQFRDFLLGDFLTSLSGPLIGRCLADNTYSAVDISFTVCMVFSGEWIPLGNNIRNYYLNVTGEAGEIPYIGKKIDQILLPFSNVFEAYSSPCDRVK